MALKVGRREHDEAGTEFFGSLAVRRAGGVQTVGPGEDDEIGALNLITPAKRLQAVSVVEDGITVSLAGDSDTVEAVDNRYPYEHTMLGISSDRIAVRYHGIAHTHLDSLAHVNANGVFYNGYTPDADAVTARGHEKNSIHNAKRGIVTRGILIDIPRLKGVPYLEPGTPIYIEDLEAWERQAGVRVSSGDAVFVRTGVWARRAAEGRGGPRFSDRLLRWSPDPRGGIWNATKETELPG